MAVLSAAAAAAPLRNVWVRRLAIPAAFLVAFVAFVFLTFPFDDLVHLVHSRVRVQRVKLPGFEAIEANQQVW